MEPATEQKPSVKYNLVSMHVDYCTPLELRLIKDMITTHFNKPQRATIRQGNRTGIALDIEGYGECACCDCPDCTLEHMTSPTPASVLMNEVKQQLWLRTN